MIQLPDNVSKARSLVRAGEMAISLVRRGYGRALSLGNEDEILFSSGALFGTAWNEMSRQTIVARTEWKMSGERLTALERFALEDENIPTFVLWHDLRADTGTLYLHAIGIQPVSSVALSEWGAERMERTEIGYVEFLYDIRGSVMPLHVRQFVGGYTLEERMIAACENTQHVLQLIRRLKERIR